MVIRKKNLLEAFTASAPEGRRAEARKKSGDAQTSAGGPFASVAPSAPRAARKLPKFPTLMRGSTVMRALADRTVRIALIAFVIVVGFAYWLGKKSGTTVEAEDAQAALPAGPGSIIRPGSDVGAALKGSDLAKKNQQTAQLGSVHDQGFMDPRNKYTLRVAQYPSDENGKKAARATVEYLRGESLPVVGPIVQDKGKTLYVCAGYEAKSEELDKLLAYVKALPGPAPHSKSPPFASAFKVNIDDYVKR